MEYFDYQPDSENVRMNFVRRCLRYERYTVSFSSAAKPLTTGSALVSADYYRARCAGSRPLLILLHGMGDTSTIPPSAIARGLSAAGFDCIVPYLIIHSRRGGIMKVKNNRLSPEDWLEIYRSSIIESRQIVDWAVSRPDIDSARIGILGISFGGIIAAITLGLDPRLSAGVLIETGGNSILINRLSRYMRKRYPGPEIDHAALLAEYEGFLTRVEKNGLANVKPEKPSFLFDPLTYASAFRDRPLLMINARHDELIPVETGRILWESSGRQEIIWLPGTHVGLWLNYPIIYARVRGFFKRNFINACRNVL